MRFSNNHPLISVIIPTFNRSKFIETAIMSVINQTYTNIEIIIVDDCSTDNTKQIIDSIQFTNIKYFLLTKNSGAQVARNKGIIESAGEWIAFLDSDDTWHKDKLKIQYNLLKENNFNEMIVIHSNCLIKHDDKNIKQEWQMPITDGNVYDLLLERPSTLFPSIMTSKKALLLINLLDENVPSYQEWDTSIRLAMYCSFIHVKKPLFTYLQHKSDNISKNKDVEIAGYNYIVNKYKNDILKLGNKIWNNHMLNLAGKCVNYNSTLLIMNYISEIKVSILISPIIKLICYLKISHSAKLRLIRAIT